MAYINYFIKTVKNYNFLNLSASINLFLLLLQLPLKAVEMPTKATFAFIRTTGVVPVADQSVLVIPCAPINTNCKEAVDYLTEVVQEVQNLNSPQIEDLNINIRLALSSLQNIEEVRTDLKGEAQIPCKMENCLVYTNWTNDENKLFWISLHKKGTTQEYPPSRAIQVKSLTSPKEIINLGESADRLKSQFSAGISYVNLSNSVAPFIQALESAQNSLEASNYSIYINEARKISNMLSVLSETWDIYIKSTSASSYVNTHRVSCETANAIRSRWNNAIGYENIGEIKGGLLGCWFVDLDNFTSPFGNTSWPRYMLETISIRLNKLHTFKRQNKGIVPTISIPINKG
jgi:hypothetical protein